MFRRRTFRKRRPTIRRRVRKYRNYGRTIRRVPRSVVVGVPKQHFAKLSYCDVNISSVAANNVTAWVYQSSAYDPYYGVGGHQPMFFDQYAAMYQKYTVLGVAYSFEGHLDLAASGTVFLTMSPTNNASAPASLSIARERTGTKETTVSTQYKGKLKGYVSCARLLGVDKRKLLTDDKYSALISANPAEVMYLNVQAWNSAAFGDVTINLSCRLTYYVRFFEPTEPAQS